MRLYLVWNRLHFSMNGDIWTSIPHSVIYSIDVLLDFLNDSVRHLWDPECGFSIGEKPDIWSHVPSRALTADNFVLARSLLQVGRCPSLCWKLRPSSSQLYAMLGPPKVSIGSDHSKCPKEECTAHDIDKIKFKTLHTSNCAGCESIVIDVDAVV
jgi:hypothetical protein